MKNVNVGIIGSGYIASIHYESYKALKNCTIIAQADSDVEKYKQFSSCGRTVPHFFQDYKEMLKLKNLHVVSVCIPNFLHACVIKDILRAGKHVIVEKPLCLSLKEGYEIAALAKKKGLLIGYAEELCYVPKYNRVKQIVDNGGIGKPYMVRQSEKHSGPHSPWFFQRDKAGGGALMDMGCHSIEFCRWMFNKQPVKWVFGHCANYLHKDIEVEDHVIATLEFMDGSVATVEASWALNGGDNSVATVFGTRGVIYADMLQHTGIEVFSLDGYPKMEGHPGDIGGKNSIGWTTPDFNWLWNNGYPQEIANFLQCVRNGTMPKESVEDGLIVLEIIAAIYLSARTGNRVYLPLENKNFDYPFELWKAH